MIIIIIILTIVIIVTIIVIIIILTIIIIVIIIILTIIIIVAKRQGIDQADMDATTRRVPQVQCEDYPSRTQSWFLEVIRIRIIMIIYDEENQSWPQSRFLEVEHHQTFIS